MEQKSTAFNDLYVDNKAGRWREKLFPKLTDEDDS